MGTETPDEPQALRQSLVDEATKFLSNPNIAGHPNEQKSAFLQKKGLTKEEISAAFAKAKVYPTAGSLTTSGPSSALPVANYHPSGPYSPMTVANYPLSPPSVWVKIRDICNFVLIITGASYGAYHIYKNFIGPLLTGRKQKSVEASMIELQQSVVMVLKEVQSTLSSLEKTLTAQNVQIQSLASKNEKGQPMQQLEELKSEVASLKALLINRRTFPSTPSLSPSIPSWQRTKATEKSLEDPSIDASNVSSKDEVRLESVHSNGEKQENEDISDGAIGGSGISVSLQDEERNPSSSENGHSAEESLVLVDSVGSSSDEMSQ